MSNLTFESQMAGMPSGKKKTHRGGRRAKGPPGDPTTHIANVQKAMTAGDHAAAKGHAFALVRSLHAAQPQSPNVPAATLAPTAPAEKAAPNLKPFPTPAKAAVEPQDNEDVGPKSAASAAARLARTLHGLGK